MHDVDRYRGSCLFVSKPRGRGQAHLRSRGPNQENQHHHQPQQQQQQQQQQSGSGGGGGNHSSSHGGHPPPHMDSSYVMEGGSALAGMPLFSFLPQRRGSLWNPSRVQHHGRQQRSPSHHQAGHQQQQQQHHVHHYLGPQEPSGGSDAGDCLFSSEDGDELERLPLARLALHTQGAPLILPSRSSPRSSPPCSGLGARPARELAHGDASPPVGSDAVSVTSDEGSTGHADTSLPRIIKPRKRRKKDRKPAPGSPPPGPGEGERGADPEAADASGSIVTLKPYMPMCYNYDAAGDDQGPRGCESSRACGCGHCVAGHMFPTPPPSPASSSAMSSVISSSSSSCSSSSEDEPGGAGGQGGDGRSQLVRSLSEPQSSHPTIHISSTVMHSFAGHRDLDIRILRSVPRDVPTRTRHWSVPAAARNHPHPAHTPQANGSSSYPSSACSTVSLLDGGASQSSSYAVTTPQPPQRPWLPLAEPDRTKPSCIFTVMCYNVLCDKYATRQMYGYCPSWALEWEYRKKGIMDEIKHYLADIITLQEVETDQFFNFFLPELKSEGYDGIFSPKSRAKHMTESERKYVDGCAIFWRTSKFSLVKEHLIEFNQLAMANHDGSEDMLNRVMTKDNIGLAALLETKEAAWENSQLLPDKSQISQPVLVCTAHIHWDPEFCDVKLIQTIMLMSEIRQIITQIVEDSQHRSRSGHKMDPNSIQLLLCGDLNSLPDSGVVEFLTKGNVSMDHEDFKGFGYKTCLQKIAMAKTNNSLVNSNSNIYTHSFKLSAAYDFSIMAYTNYTYDFKGIIDYIFHSSETMSALGVLGPIDTDWFKDNKVLGCPHPHIPSDHFPLLVQLEMRPASASISQPNGLLHR